MLRSDVLNEGQPTNGLQPCHGLGDIGDKNGSEAEMDPAELALEPEDPHPSVLYGTCFLAILPSGHMSGHIVESCSYDSEPSGRTLGLIARCVASSSGRPGCMEDNDTDFLRITILNLQVCAPASCNIEIPTFHLCNII